MIPSTNALVTESSTPTVVPSETRSTTTETTAADDSYEALIAAAPHGRLADFRQGSTSATSERLQNLSGIHFSTPDRSIRCSTGNSGADALVCVSALADTPSTPPQDAPADCTWATDMVTLNSTGYSAGACADRYPVLHRSQILEYGRSLTVGRYSCLSEVEGLFCLVTDAEEGFALTRDGVEKISAGEPAPARLRGVPENDSATSTTAPSN
ncbi:MAG: hypothetical protein QM809_08860 [Gordonia sp. (in: high G+C Gram-positive bacteria)]|uniref:hypothetical protein n=1 Tax=Gordonia sp. (in: high G+C Gram-positive bacteria) TaxID=84139 RepID=UPI0039E426D4